MSKFVFRKGVVGPNDWVPDIVAWSEKGLGNQVVESFDEPTISEEREFDDEDGLTIIELAYRKVRFADGFWGVCPWWDFNPLTGTGFEEVES